MAPLDWREVTGGTFVAATACFSITVHRTADSPHARFRMLVRKLDGPGALIASGTMDGISGAMNAAQKNG